MPLNVIFDPPILTLPATEEDGRRTPDIGELLIEALAPDFTVEAGPSRTEVLTHLDTVDGRLHAAGIDLAHVARRRRLVAVNGVQQVEQPVTGTWPRLVADLPVGDVSTLIAGPAWIRALIPYATTQAQTTTYAVRNRDGKAVARVHSTVGALSKPATVDLPVRVGIESLRGYGAEADQVRRGLGKNTPLTPTRAGSTSSVASRRCDRG